MRVATENSYTCTATSRKPNASLERPRKAPLLMIFRIRAVAKRFRLPPSADHAEAVAQYAFGWAQRIAGHYLRDDVERHRRKRFFARSETIQRMLENAPAADD